MTLFPEEPLNRPASNGYGYFPAFPGLHLLDNKYEVVHKLGYGPRSSTWLAKDKKNTQYIALKILTVHASQQANHELDALKLLQGEDLDNFPVLKCHFIVSSHHGDHVCLGLAVMGTSVEDLRLSSPSKTLPLHVVKRVVGSMLSPMSYLHKRSIIHGALMPENMLFFAGQTREDIERQLAALPRCIIENKIVDDGVEYPIVRSHPLVSGLLWNSSKADFAAGSVEPHNLGHACIIKKGTHPDWFGVEDGLRPPEVIIETSYDMKVDVWMLGCAAFKLLTGEPLVPPQATEDDVDQLAWIQAMVQDVIQPEMGLRSPEEVRDWFFDSEGLFKFILPEQSMESRFDGLDRVTSEEKEDTIRFIDRCLTLDPADRPTMDELTNDPWLLPGYACSCGICGAAGD